MNEEKRSILEHVEDILNRYQGGYLILEEIPKTVERGSNKSK